MKIKSPLRFSLLGLALLSLGIAPAFAQSGHATGKVKIHVSPKQAYVFVDGKAIRDGSQTIELSAGSHAIGVDNYGYTPKRKMWISPPGRRRTWMSSSRPRATR